MTTLTFRVIRQRWNMNTVRLPVSPWIWRRDRESYFASVAEIVRRANAESLWVILTASDDARAGSPSTTALPGPEIAEFWSAAAAYFQNTPMIVFSLYAKPSAQFVPGAIPGTRRPADWNFWRNGGTAADGRTVIGMEQLVSRIRAAGAAQMIAAPAFNDALDLRSFDSAFQLSDPNVLYEIYPYFDHALTTAQRDTNFGSVAGKVPVYAGEWGTPLQEDSASCRSVPRNPADASNAVVDMLTYMASQAISWTAASFEPGSLIQDSAQYDATQFSTWACGQSATQSGMGATVLFWITGDPLGFGSLLPELIANAAANRVGPIAPGEIISLYGQGLGPEQDVPGSITDSGVLDSTAGDVRVSFDGIPAPIFSAGSFQVTAQVPYEIAGRSSTTLQAFYRDVPSNKLVLQLQDTSPSLFTTSGFQDLLAINQEGFRNSSSTPAAAGSIVTLYGSGLGELSPSGRTGQVAAPPFALHTSPVSILMGGASAEVLYAGAAPGLVGITQINVKVPSAFASGNSRAISVSLLVGTRTVTGFRLWIR